MGRSAGEGQEQQSSAEAGWLRVALAWTWAAVVVLWLPPWLKLLDGPTWPAYAVGGAMTGVALARTAQARRPR